MAKKAPEAAPPPAKHRKLVSYVREEHIEGLMAESHRRATERRAIRVDVSELVREALDGWLAALAKGRR